MNRESVLLEIFTFSIIRYSKIKKKSGKAKTDSKIFILKYLFSIFRKKLSKFFLETRNELK